MIDIPRGQRVRQCTTVLIHVENPCPLMTETGAPFRCDRDGSSTLNFCFSGFRGLLNKDWPVNLLRGSSVGFIFEVRKWP